MLIQRTKCWCHNHGVARASGSSVAKISATRTELFEPRTCGFRRYVCLGIRITATHSTNSWPFQAPATPSAVCCVFGKCSVSLRLLACRSWVTCRIAVTNTVRVTIWYWCYSGWLIRFLRQVVEPVLFVDDSATPRDAARMYAYDRQSLQQ